MDVTSSIISLLVTLLVTIVIFLVIREIVLWYWRINEMADNIAYIANHFRRIDQEAGRKRIEETRQATGASSPFVPMGNRPSRSSTTPSMGKWPEG